jgi:hypothetical protein
MKAKRFLVYVNKVISVFTLTLLLLFISYFPAAKKGKPIRIPLAVNVIILAILLIIVAAYGGAFSNANVSSI